MNLNELQLKTQVRTPWQALDMGVLMARRWYRPLLLAWLVPAFLLYLLLGAALYDTPWAVLLAVWWCKPLLDRLPLLLLSRYIFNDHSGGIFNWRSLLRLYRFDLLPALLWRRPDLKRSFNLAVTVLEQQKGKARSRRCAALAPGSGNAATWLTVVMVHLEMLLPLSAGIAVVMLFSGYIDINPMPLLVDESGFYAHFSNLALLLGMSLVAPVYIAAGFALYLNRRIELEAWDLELLFRESIRQRGETAALKPQMASSVMGLLLALLIGVAGLSPLGSMPVHAAEPPQSQQALAREEVRTILESPPFVIEKEVTEWQWKSQPNAPQEDPQGWDWLRHLLGLFGNWNLGWLFQLVEVLLWVGVGLLVWLVLRTVLKHLPLTADSGGREHRNVAAPRVVMGMQISADSLPDDIEAAVAQAFEQGDVRLAVSLIYRHILHLLVDDHRVPVESWYTELECAAAVKVQPGLSVAALFDELTRLWLKLAYAHEPPQREQVERLHRELREALEK